MSDITDAMSRYREAARHLWNASFRAVPVDWDARDRFHKVERELFTALVLEPLAATEQSLPYTMNPWHFERIAVVPASDRITILVNREAQSHGYWDDPVNTLNRGDAELRFVDFFDWADLEARDFKFALVRIIEWESQPHLVGRFALVEFAFVRFQLLPGPGAQLVHQT